MKADVESHSVEQCLSDTSSPLCPRVTLQNRSAVILRIKAEVVDQHLEVFDLQVSTVHL